MTPHSFRSARLGVALLASAAFSAGAAHAQVQGFGGAGAYREDAGSALSRHLRTLADNPRNHSALMGAGEAALKLGDPQAAITFFARAEEIAPRDGRIKAGIGSAFVQMEQPHSAIKFFSDAAALGVNEGEFAADRGLAYDVLGNPKQAQRDYQLALRYRPDPEVERRLALSLAISGDKAGALAAIDGQLRRQDRAGWRTRAFVLALTGDAAGADQAVQSVIPGQAAALRPFLARLPSLDMAGRAMAVHFGHFPGDGQTIQMAQNYAPAPTYTPAPAYSPPPRQQPAPLASASNRASGRTSTQPPASSQNREPAGAAGQRTQVAAARPVREPTRSSSRDRDLERVPGSLIRESVRSQSPQRTVSAAPRPTPAPSSGTQLALSAPRVVAPAPAAPVQSSPPAASTNSATGSGLVASSQFSLSAPTLAPATNSPPPAAAAPVITDVSTSQTQTTPTVAPPAGQPPASTGIQRIDLPSSAAASTAEPSTITGTTPTATATAPALAQAAPVETSSSASPPATPDAAASANSGGGLADIASLVNSLPSTEEAKKPEPGLPKLAQADVKTPPKEPAVKEKPEPAKAKPAKKTEAAAKEAPKKEAPKPAEPARHWVQVAGGADRAGLVREFGKLKQKAPKLLGDRTAWTTPLRFTNRLLVGPFKSEDEAQAFVNELARTDVTAFSWTSPAGQEIAKLTAK